MSQEFSIASELVPADAPRGRLVKRDEGRTVYEDELCFVLEGT